MRYASITVSEVGSAIPAERPFSIADTKIESPYNTYMNPGLPIGPIASPGIASIKAVLYPADTDYYYFVVDGSGVHHFSKTLAQHNAAVSSASATWGTGTVG